MMINKNLLAAAVTGLVLGVSGIASAQQTVSAGDSSHQQLDTDAGAKHACKGQNACKGQGGCKTDQNACKGQGGCNTATPKDKNSCAGKGGCGSK